MTKKQSVLCWVVCLILCIVFVCGFVEVLKKMQHSTHHRGVRISRTAISEITAYCSGNYKDLLANREYVYANCNVPFYQPITVQNYRLK